jgi:asparagine synthase (glutamine-hydrolysing)
MRRAHPLHPLCPRLPRSERRPPTIMCGIVVSWTPLAPTPVAVAQAMANRLRHRGPDDEGFLLWSPGQNVRLLGGVDTPEAVMQQPTPWRPTARVADEAQRSAPLLMAHRRLAIVDLSPWGHQPMRRGAWHGVFNGEIYNHVELRSELQGLGHAFVSHSDTEVLLAVLQQWGPQGLARCNGMWAFAALDTESRTLWVARDRFGVKPLYVWQGAGGALVLASEIKALLVHPLVRSAPEAARVAAYLQHGPSAWQLQTEFAGITRFPPGHWAQIDLNAPTVLAPQAWWSHPEPDAQALRVEAQAFDARSAAAHIERYTELLQSAVRQRMRVDVRLGTALSGGLDSSSIAVLVNEQLQSQGRAARQEVFSSVYPSAATAGAQGADESGFINRVSQQLGLNGHRIEPLAAQVPAAHEHLIWALDTPPEGSLMSSWHTFGLVAKTGVVVTLDGQGADEQLAGYSRYVRNRLAHAPVGAALADAWALTRGLQGFGSAVGVGLAAGALRRLAGPHALAAVAQRLNMGADPSPTVAQALAQDFQTHLQNLLHYADKTSMAWSVESRLPFMDYRLVTYLASVPSAYKIHGGWTKWLARQAFATRLPAPVVWRRDKMGWAIPEAAWFSGTGPLASWLQTQLTRSAFARDAAAAAGINIRHAPLKHSLRLLSLARWHQLYFEEAGQPGRILGRGMPLGTAAAEGVSTFASTSTSKSKSKSTDPGSAP